MSADDMMKILTDLKGIGEAKAAALIDAGFDRVEKIQSASIDELTAVQGISETVATSLQKQLKKTTPAEQKPKKTPSDKKEQVEKKPEPKMSKSSEKKPEVKKEEETKPEKKKETGKKTEFRKKKKPELSDELKKYLPIRKEIKDRTPNFYREEWFRYKRLGKSWRRPDGITSKMRRNYKYRPSKVRVGFRGPKKVRGLHPSGFEEIRICTVSDLENIDPKTQAVRISSGVGMRKRLQIQEKAKELDVRVLNEQR